MSAAENFTQDIFKALIAFLSIFFFFFFSDDSQ